MLELFGSSSLFFIIVGILFGSCIIINFWPSSLEKWLKPFAFNTSLFVFFLSLLFWIKFNASTPKFQFVTSIPWLASLNVNFSFGIDGISLFLIILTTFLCPLCILGSWHSIKFNVKNYLISFLLIEGLLLCVFAVLDLFLFYVFFESILIPMYFLIGLWGSRRRKIRAAYILFIYTLFGSLFMLLAIFYIFSKTGTTNYEILIRFPFTEFEQKVLWVAFFLSFATKIPMIPFHIWLPEAHVEAPTAGSVLLAGILLKLGTYGFLRISLPLFPEASIYFAPLVYALSAMGVVFTSFTAIRQIDLKKVIAYASVAHMNLVVLGLFSFNLFGIEGGYIQSLSHGFVSSALFFIIGIYYDRYHSRVLKFYSGMTLIMPLTTFMFLFFTMANIGLPGTSSFVGEFLILIGLYQTNTTLSFVGATGMVLGGAYSLWLFNRISYGNLKTNYVEQRKILDIQLNEFFTLLPLVIGTLFMGLYPVVFLKPIHICFQNLIFV